ncbi:MAG: hypothetical protein O7I42_13540 [Alphaproteobacteria bacterium]|nr:hypothetical protein [Alphaproteobacteria bacterium]
MAPRINMRKMEEPHADNTLADEALSEDDLLAAMIADPIPINPPIVLAKGQARIGRTPENVLESL